MHGSIVSNLQIRNLEASGAISRCCPNAYMCVQVCMICTNTPHRELIYKIISYWLHAFDFAMFDLIIWHCWSHGTATWQNCTMKYVLLEGRDTLTL